MSKIYLGKELILPEVDKIATKDNVPDNYQAKLVSGTNIKTINNQSILGEGNINISSSPMTSITYSELKALRDNSQLVPGMQYRITNYTYTGNQNNTVFGASHNFDIIVTADSVNKLNENARACLHEGDTYFANCKLEAWRLKYAIDNDTNRFEVAKNDGFGVIYWMKDEWNNECPYDFKNVQFKVYVITECSKCPDLVGKYSFMDIPGITANGQAKYTYTFGENDKSLKGRAYNNKITPYILNNKFLVNSIVFLDNNSYDNLHDNVIYSSKNIVFGSDCFGNTINTSNNIFMGNSCVRNTIHYNSYNNIFADNCTGNQLGIDCHGNVFNSVCYGIILNDYCESNIFEGRNNSITFNKTCTNNKISPNCNYIEFGIRCQNIQILKEYVYHIIFEGCNRYVDISSEQTTSISNVIQNIKISQGLSSKHSIMHNTFNSGFQTIYKATGSTEIEV